MKMTEELAKRCDMQLRDIDQQADDLTYEKFDSFDAKFHGDVGESVLTVLNGIEVRSHLDPGR